MTKLSAKTDSRGAAIRLMGAASAIAMMTMLSSPAFAQATTPAEEDAGEDIVVTGIQASIANSVSVKREEVSIVEVVSAEEIGKLPDVSIAESIARLPGLTAQRVGGRAQTISIRGLAPDFSTTLLNGRQQASSGDNRGVEFDQYPSELLRQVVVYKTPDANVSGMGLSGTIDLRTVRPLDTNDRVIAVNLRGELTSGDRLNSDVRNYGGRFSISYVDQNESGTLGWAIGYAHLDAPSQNRQYKAYGYETFGSNRAPLISPDSADTATFLTGQEIFATSREQRRDAVMGVIEWQPSDAVHVTTDLYYSRFSQNETRRGAQWFSNVWADSQQFQNVGTALVGGTTVGVTGRNTGVAPIVRNDYNTRDDELFSAGLNAEFQMTEDLSFIADLSYSHNSRDESITETYAGAFTGATPAGINNTNQNANRQFDTINWDISNLVSGNGYPSYTTGLNYADAARISLGDRAPWGGWGHDGQTKEPHVNESVYALDLGFHYDIGGDLFDSIDFGVNFTHRDKDKRVDEFDLNLKNGRAQTLVASQYLVNPTNLGYAGFGNVLSVDLRSAIPVYYDRITFLDDAHFDKAWSLSEELITGRMRLNIDNGPLRGNLGLQVIYADQSSSGFSINRTLNPRVVTPYTDGADYTDFLPSLNLSYDLGGGHRIRFAAARQVARPRVDELRANFTPSFNNNPCANAANCIPAAPGQPPTLVKVWSANGGNPNLQPWRANAVDLAYEWYIGRASYFSVGLFYKDLRSYIYTDRQPFDFTGLPIPSTAVPLPPGTTYDFIGQANQPANGHGGYIKGIEISGALELGRIASFLEGFGVQGGYSINRTNLHPLALNAAGTNQAAIQATRIPGFSRDTYNITGYFERAGFQARASYRGRAAFKGEVTALFASRGVTEILAEHQIDAQIGYTFQEGSPLAGFGILLQANNLDNSPYATRLGTDGGGIRTADGSFLGQDYETYGTQYLFGFSYRF